jgi:acetyl-CoA synthetase
VLKALGVKRGDRITIYLPMIPETAYAMLACTRIGAIHSVVFGGFSPESLANRITDCGSKLVITADEGVRGGKKIPLKANVDAALQHANGVEKVLVLRHTGDADSLMQNNGVDVWYHEIVHDVTSECAPEPMNAEDPMFILYTSGSTGKPKGVLHTTGGYLVYAAMTHQYVFDYHNGDIYWCTADVGWVTGHTYIVYGPLANGATTLMFEGVPNYPSVSRFWEVVDKHQVNIFYTAPTAIRALMRDGEAPVKRTSRASLKLIGTVGEPINPEAWLWYYRTVDGHEARQRHAPVFRRQAGARRRERKIPGRRGERQSCAARFLAWADAHCLRRPRPVLSNLFQHLCRHVLHRRRLPARRRRVLLDHRPGR